MIAIFDLDDTLYDESTFVDSGFAAVAADGEDRYGWPADASLRRLRALLVQHGRGRVFNLWLAEGGVTTRKAIRRCVHVYRHHIPQLVLDPHAARVLNALEGRLPLYLVTDGHKVVQANKVRALGLEARFDRVLITHRFGVHNAKPSLHCFARIREWAKADWSALTYVGDNPAKDFVALNRMGARTVRVRTGRHRDDPAPPGHEAQHQIQHLGELERVCPEWFTAGSDLLGGTAG